MTAYRLHWKKQPPGLIDGSGLRPDRLRGMSMDEVTKEPVRCGRRQFSLGELFDIEVTDDHESPEKGTAGQASSGTRVEAGMGAGTSSSDVQGTLCVSGSERFIGLAAGMTGGTLEVDGHAGEGVGSGMTGGCITVHGSTGNLAGAGMAGGVLVVEGDVADLAGGPRAGELRGMTGGELLVRGNAGHYTGSRQRSGLLAVGGSVGQCPAYRMLAGTLLVGEGELISPGLGMGRGTVIALNSTPRVLPTFRRDGLVQPVVLRLLWRRLAELKIALPEGLDDACFVSFSGDMLNLHRGELLFRQTG